MTDRTSAYAQAVVALATGEGALDIVEDELLAVARAVDGTEELRQRLTDIHLPLAQRLTFVESQVLEVAHPATRAALAMLIAAGRVGDVAAIANEVAERAAASRDEELAEVIVAVPLDDARKAALKQALERATGRKLDLKVIVDDSVVGGVRAKIGDTVLDTRYDHHEEDPWLSFRSARRTSPTRSNGCSRATHLTWPPSRWAA